MDKQFSKIFIKKVQLISDAHPSYQKFMLRYKTKKEKDVVYDKPSNSKSGIMGYLLELSIREWVNKSGLCLNEKIICWEQIEDGKYSKLFKELDYVLLKGKTHFIGEVKVSLTENGNVPTACKQLSSSKELLAKILGAMTLQIIRIDMNFNNATESFDEFNPDFSKAKFRDYEWNEQKYQILYLNARDVFNYGVQNKVIMSPEIFEPAVYETDLLHNQKQLRKQLKENNDALLEISNTDELENIQSEITHLERKLFLGNVKLNLSQKGWIHLTNISADEFTAITNSISNSIEQANPTNDFCVKTNGYCTDKPTTKFLSLYCDNAETEINLLDAERVYMRIPIEEGHDLQNIEFVVPDNSLDKLKNFPLYSRFPTRKFFYSDSLLRQSDSENKSLQHYEQVINNSQPTKILLQLSDLLIIDNHRMLHQRTTNTDNLKRKIILELL